MRQGKRTGRGWLGVALLMAFAPYGAQAQEPQPVPAKESDVMPYLEQTTAWRRSVADSDITADTAREVLLKDKLRVTSKSAALKSVAFARAAAAMFEAEAQADAKNDAKNDAKPAVESRRTRLLKAKADADQRVSDLQTALKEQDIGGTMHEKLSGELKLAKARQELLQNMVTIFSGEGDKGGALTDQINMFARTGLSDTSEQPVKDDAAAKVVAVKDKTDDTPSENGGMFRLSGNLITLSHKKDDIGSLLMETNRLSDSTRGLIGSIRVSLKAALAEGSALTAAGDDRKSLTAYRESVDKLVVHYKQLSAAIMPLGEASVLLDNAQAALSEWQRLTDDNWKQLFHQLLIRLIVLSISVAIPLIVSGLARRATNRYVTDPRRLKQLRIVRRVVLFSVLTFVILANFLTEFGSLATFAGFITAGLAVALQTVLISLVAHFLFFGRYGVRAGDRVTVMEVTGDVVQVGILRLYIRELKDTEDGLKPTGKVVAFPNSILFQPTAFYKHMPDVR